MSKTKTKSIIKNKYDMKLMKRKFLTYSKIFDSIDCSKLTKNTDKNTELNFYIKGTCNINTILSNLNIGVRNNYHKGWLNMANIIFTENKKLFESAIKKNKKIFIIGISLGAAVGTYLISLILDLYTKFKKNPELHLSGFFMASPRSTSKKQAEKLHPYIYNLLHLRDIITYLPLGSLVIPGSIISINNNDKLISFFNYLEYSKYLKKQIKIKYSFYPHHFLSNYIKIIKNNFILE